MGRVMAEDGFETIVATHHAEIRRYLLRVTARATDADDLSQETFLRAFRAYRRLPAEVNVRAWLFAIATNLGKNHFRGLARRRRAYAAAAQAGTERDASRPEEEALMRERGPWEAEIALAELAALRLPTLVVSGAHSPAYEAICDVLERELHAERVVIPGHGHNPQLSPAFTDALSDFVARASR